MSSSSSSVTAAAAPRPPSLRVVLQLQRQCGHGGSILDALQFEFERRFADDASASFAATFLDADNAAEYGATATDVDVDVDDGRRVALHLASLTHETAPARRRVELEARSLGVGGVAIWMGDATTAVNAAMRRARGSGGSSGAARQVVGLHASAVLGGGVEYNYGGVVHALLLDAAAVAAATGTRDATLILMASMGWMVAVGRAWLAVLLGACPVCLATDVPLVPLVHRSDDDGEDGDATRADAAPHANARAGAGAADVAAPPPRARSRDVLHAACFGCAVQLARTAPASVCSCGVVVPPRTFAAVLSAGALRDRELAAERAQLRQAGMHVATCPACNTNQGLEPRLLQLLRERDADGNIHGIACHECRTHFCYECSGVMHYGAPCALAAMRAVDGGGSGGAVGGAASLAAAVARGGFMACPCGTLMERVAGCLHMRHDGCAAAARLGYADGVTHFCYACGVALAYPPPTVHLTAVGSTTPHFPQGVYGMRCENNEVGEGAARLAAALHALESGDDAAAAAAPAAAAAAPTATTTDADSTATEDADAAAEAAAAPRRRTHGDGAAPAVEEQFIPNDLAAWTHPRPRAHARGGCGWTRGKTRGRVGGCKGACTGACAHKHMERALIDAAAAAGYAPDAVLCGTLTWRAPQAVIVVELAKRIHARGTPLAECKRVAEEYVAHGARDAGSAPPRALLLLRYNPWNIARALFPPPALPPPAAAAAAAAAADAAAGATAAAAEAAASSSSEPDGAAPPAHVHAAAPPAPARVYTRAQWTRVHGALVDALRRLWLLAAAPRDLRILFLGFPTAEWRAAQPALAACMPRALARAAAAREAATSPHKPCTNAAAAAAAAATALPAPSFACAGAATAAAAAAGAPKHKRARVAGSADGGAASAAAAVVAP